jgi:AmpD protein
MMKRHAPRGTRDTPRPGSRAKLSDEGLLEGARYVASPNCDERPPGCAIDLLVIHYISLPPGEFGGGAIEAFFMNRLDAGAHPFFATIADLKASAHFLVRRDGEVIQFVPCAKRAWHAGESSWKGRPRCNDFSIGIEVEGDGEVPFTAAQYRRLAALTRVLMARYPIAESVGHSDIAPARKVDPGPQFDWARYRALVETPRRGGRRRKKIAARRRPMRR